MTTPINRVQQLIRRTKKNLDAIDKLHSNGDETVYEVTQLVNSCLAVIVHVHESKITKSKDFDLPPVKPNSWPDLSPTKNSLSNPLRWSEQMRLLRNGIAHGNIKFHPENSGKEITHIEIENKLNGDNGKMTWGAMISVNQMRQMIGFIDTKFGQDG